MPNPWRDPEKARNWTPHGKAGNVQRPEQIGIVLALIAAQDPTRVLDLGCGMGDIDAALLERCPGATLVCLDESAVMLERTRAALGARAEGTVFIASALQEDWVAQAGGSFDTVMANQCVHHLAAEDKRVLFARVSGLLRPGGLFLLNDKLAFDGGLWPHMVDLWDRVRIPAGFEPFSRRGSHAAYVAEEIEGGDVPDSLETQLGWLREAGFDPVDCFWRYADKAIFGGLRAPT